VIEQNPVPADQPGQPAGAARRGVPMPNRRMRAMTQEERRAAGQTERRGGREAAVPPVAATDGPQPPSQPPLPGPGIAPPVAAEPRGPRPQNPPVAIDIKKLWIRKPASSGTTAAKAPDK
jgi:hypothetical protein